MSTHDQMKEAYDIALRNGTRAWLVTVSPVGQDRTGRRLWIRFADREDDAKRTAKAAAELEGLRVRTVQPIRPEDLWRSYTVRFVGPDGSTVAEERLHFPDDRSVRSWAAGARVFHNATTFVATETATGRRVG